MDDRDSTLRVVAFSTADGEVERFNLQAKNFSTGSRGFWAGGKITLNGKRYQVSTSIVEIGSKPSA